MPTAKLSIEVPEGTWASDVSSEHPGVKFEVLTAHAREDGGVGLVQMHGPEEELRSAVRAAEEHPTTRGVEVLDTREGTALVQFETAAPLMLLASHDSGAPFETPFEIRDGVGEWTVTSSREGLSKLGDKLESMGLEFSVQHVGEAGEDPLLTEKQREILELAEEMGYYDTPREASLSDVAEAAGVAKSTASETLHRAEGKVVKDYL